MYNIEVFDEGRGGEAEGRHFPYIHFEVSHVLFSKPCKKISDLKNCFVYSMFITPWIICRFMIDDNTRNLSFYSFEKIKL